MTADARGGRGGRPLVLIIIIVPFIMAAGAMWFRHSSKENFVAMLENEGPNRIRAFSGLLQMNALRKLSRQYAYLPKETYEGPHRHYVKYEDPHIGELYFLQGFDMDVRERNLDQQLERGVVFVVDRNGETRHALRGGRLYLVGEAPGKPVVVTNAPGTPGLLQVSFVGSEVSAAVVVRDGLRLETLHGEARVAANPPGNGSSQPAAESWPLLRYDGERTCFVLADGRAVESDSVVREASRAFCE